MYDLIIIGAGPAGLTSAIYASRAGLKTLVFEKTFSGGQMTTTPEVENYPGIEKISGIELAMRMEQHAKSMECEFKNEDVFEIKTDGDVHTVVTTTGSYKARTVIVALGAKRRMLGIEGEERLAGRGVSYCATCDGGFFKGRDVCIVGGGNTALEDALYLAGICNKVYLIHRRDAFRGFDSLDKAVRSNKKIELVLDSVPINIAGDQKVENVLVKNIKTERMREIPTDAVFIAVGVVPDTELLVGKVELTKSGHVKASENTHTSMPGIYAAGDIREKPMYQIVTACADGAVAAREAGMYINERTAKN